MKISFVKSLVVILAFIILSKASFSQTAATSEMNTLPIAYNTDPIKGSQVKIQSSEVTDKALKNFTDYFNDVPNVIWYRQGKEYMAEFRKEGKWVKAYFTAKGNFISSFAITTEEYLPEDIRIEINRVYNHFKIASSTEVVVHNSTTWFVNLENDKRFMQVRIADGQMEEVYDRKKSE